MKARSCSQIDRDIATWEAALVDPKKAHAVLNIRIATQSGCFLCPEYELVCLEPHKRNGSEIGEKTYMACANMRKYDLLRYLQDTTPLCSNCHAKWHSMDEQK